MDKYILLVKGRFEWLVVSNPRFDLPIQEGLAAQLLNNEFNGYVEYENCGSVYRVVRAKDYAAEQAGAVDTSPRARNSDRL